MIISKRISFMIHIRFYVPSHGLADKKGFDSVRYPIKSVKRLQSKQTTICLFYVRKIQVERNPILNQLKLFLLSLCMNVIANSLRQILLVSVLRNNNHKDHESLLKHVYKLNVQFIFHIQFC